MSSSNSKYYQIVITNLVILSALLLIGTNDCLEKHFNSSDRFLGLLKILGLSSLILIVNLWGSKFSNKITLTKDEFRNKMYLAFGITLLLSSLLYIQFFSKILTYKIQNAEIRKSICMKMKTCEWLNCTRIENMTFAEYKEIHKLTYAPDIPKEAMKINYGYSYDCLLPDYFLSVDYEVPLNVEIDTFKNETEQYRENCTFEIHNNIKKVSYGEIRM